VSAALPETLYAASADNVEALWRSSDGGRSWTWVSDRQSRGLFLYSLVADPYTSSLYAIGGGVYRSEDGGVTWNDLGLPPTGDLVFLAPGILLASSQSGLLRSTDNGGSWTLVWPVSGDLTADPENPDTVYQAYLERRPDDTLTGVVDRSLDGGLSWQRLAEGGPDIHPAPGGILYLPTSLGLRRSLDQGVTWETVGPLPPDRQWLMVDPRDAEKLYVATGFHGLFRSTDHGVTWEPANPGLARRGIRLFTLLVPHPAAPHTFFALPMNGGIFVARFTDR
jgi:hypothetical protein